MAINKSNENVNKCSLKISSTTNANGLRLILHLTPIVSLICLLLLLYNKPTSFLKLHATISGECEFHQRVIRRVKHPFSGVAIEVSCRFLDQVRVFNAALDHLRLDLLSMRHSKDWRNISHSENIKLIGGADEIFLQQLGNFSQVQTVFLPWAHNKAKAWTSLVDTSNILVNNYFEWTADEELRRWINSSGVSRYAHYITHNRTCVKDIQKKAKSQSLRLLDLNSKPLWEAFYWPNNGTSYPPHFYREQPAFAFYLHIIHDCIVTPNSEVWSGSMYLVQHTCSYNANKIPPQNINRLPLYDEV